MKGSSEQDILSLDEYRSRVQASVTATNAVSDTGLGRAQSPSATVAPTKTDARGELRALSELYPVGTASSILDAALAQIEQAYQVCERALDLLASNDWVDADLETMRLPSIFAELFCCRELGEGLGNVAESLMSALELRKGSPLEAAHIVGIRDALDKIYHSPGLTYDDSIELVISLNESGLDTEPDLNALSETLNQNE